MFLSLSLQPVKCKYTFSQSVRYYYTELTHDPEEEESSSIILLSVLVFHMLLHLR